MSYEGWPGVIDTSEAQGGMDGQRAATAGIRYAIVRVHNGRRKDRTVEADVASYRAAGIEVLAGYGFVNRYSHLGSTQGSEAARITRDLGIPAYMHDAEWDDNEPKDIPRPADGAPSARFYRAVADAAMSVMGRPGIVYTSGSFWNPATANSSVLADHDLIVANYVGYHKVFNVIVDLFPRGWAPGQWGHLCETGTTKRPSPAGGFRSVAGWQFSAGGNAQGHAYGARSTDLDLNIIDPAVIARWRGGAVNPPDWHVPAGVPEEDDDMPRVGPYFVQPIGSPDIYLTDGRMMTLRHMQTPEMMAGVQWWLKTSGHPAEAVDASPEQVADLGAFGVIIG